MAGFNGFPQHWLHGFAGTGLFLAGFPLSPRRASKSHECASATPLGPVWVRARYRWSMYIPSVRCSLLVRVRRAHARRTAPCKQIIRMTPQRRLHAARGCVGACTLRLSCCMRECPRWAPHAPENALIYRVSKQQTNWMQTIPYEPLRRTPSTPQ